jgi:hypothetical protein
MNAERFVNFSEKTIGLTLRLRMAWSGSSGDKSAFPCDVKQSKATYTPNPT